MNQKEIKALKKQVQEESAFNVGFNAGLPAAILKQNEDLLFWVFKERPEVADWLSSVAKEDKIGEFMNIFVSEAIQSMNYQDFKAVASYFFSYKQTEYEILAEPIEVSRRLYEQLQEDSNRLFSYEHPTSDLEHRIEQLTTKTVKNENEVIAFNLLTQEVAVLENENFDIEPYFDEGIITDYRKNESEISQIAGFLLKKGTLSLYRFFVEGFMNNEMRTSHYPREVIQGITQDILDNHPEFEDDENLIVFDVGLDSYNDNQFDLNGIFYNELTIDDIYHLSVKAGYHEDTKDSFIDFLNDGFSYSFHDLQDYVSESIFADENYYYIDKINLLLSEANQELVFHTVRGYSQGDVWTLAYLLDHNENSNISREHIEQYLEHEIGAYYRDSLTELVIYDQNQKETYRYAVDREEFWNGGSYKVQELSGNQGFVSLENALIFEEINAPFSQAKLEQFVVSTPEQQAEILNQLKSKDEATEEKGLVL